MIKIQSTGFLLWIVQGIGIGVLVSFIFFAVKMVKDLLTTASQASAGNDAIND